MSEFERLHRLDAIGAGDSIVEIAADPAERTALAARFGWPALDRLDARFTLRRDTAGIFAQGHVAAALAQACVVTGEPVPATVDEEFAIRFVPEDATSGDEVELAAEDCDTVFYSGGAIDLGEAAAETLVLALDPFPRSPAAAAALKEAGVVSEEEAGPFGGLAALRDRLAKNDDRI